MRSSVIDALRAERLVAVIRRPAELDRSIDELVAAGVRVIEITLDTPGAFAAIAGWCDRTTVLAGTVRRPEEVEAAADAGAAAIPARSRSVPTPVGRGRSCRRSGGAGTVRMGTDPGRRASERGVSVVSRARSPALPAGSEGRPGA